MNPHGVGEENLGVLSQLDLSRQRIESSEQPVLDKNLRRVSDRAKDRRLAGVGLGSLY
jgi:hypothetical protein